MRLSEWCIRRLPTTRSALALHLPGVMFGEALVDLLNPRKSVRIDAASKLAMAHGGQKIYQLCCRRGEEGLASLLVTDCLVILSGDCLAL